MLKVFLLIVAYTTADGQIQLKEQIVDQCPSNLLAISQMEELKAAGYVKGWGYWCRDVFIEIAPGKKS